MKKISNNLFFKSSQYFQKRRIVRSFSSENPISKISEANNSFRAMENKNMSPNKYINLIRYDIGLKMNLIPLPANKNYYDKRYIDFYTKKLK